MRNIVGKAETAATPLCKSMQILVKPVPLDHLPLHSPPNLSVGEFLLHAGHTPVASTFFEYPIEQYPENNSSVITKPSRSPVFVAKISMRVWLQISGSRGCGFADAQPPELVCTQTLPPHLKLPFDHRQK
eukprot:GHVQ01003672.1.p1 GENE.GHVQ01003672.1~~GHVQ01003672.1.p1  ORF type:complete len:130 (+),score=7.24 GHVQ01003672.1:424-813(+)